MKPFQVYRLLQQSTLAAIFAIAVTTSSSDRARAQSLSTIEETAEQIEIHFIPANSEKNGSDPESNTAGDDGFGSRGDCIATAIPITRLVGHRDILDLTVSQYPTFWFYVPYTPEQATSGIFSLQDPAGLNEYWRTEFQLPENSGTTTPGIVSITLPQSAEPLERDFTYQWFFELNCPLPEPSNQFTTAASIYGRVKRVEVNPELEEKLNDTTNPLERAAIYASEGLWYNALTEVGELYQENPQSAALGNLWSDLLKDIGFEEVATEPMVGEVEIRKPENSQ